MVDSKIEEFLNEGNKLLTLQKESVRISASRGIADLTGNVDKTKFTEWKYKIEDFLSDLHGDNNRYLKRFEENVKNSKVQDVKTGIGILNIMKNNNTNNDDTSSTKFFPNKVKNKKDDYDNLDNVLNNLHKMINKLTIRRESREPLIMNDEYDVQYLLSSLLMLLYEDVRVEESMPSSVKSCNRIDIFIPEISAAIETKYLKDAKNEKKIIAQIKEDIISYQKHPTIKKLYFYIYDSNKNIINPKAYVNDLSGKHNELDVKIIINY